MTNPIYNNETFLEWLNSAAATMDAQGNVGAQLDVDGAVEFLNQEFFNGEASSGAKAFLKEIVNVLPEQARTNSETLKNVDLRFAIQDVRSGPPIEYGRQDAFGVVYELDAGMVDTFSKRIEDKYRLDAELYVKAIAPEQESLSAEELQRRTDEVLSRQTGFSPYAYARARTSGVQLPGEPTTNVVPSSTGETPNGSQVAEQTDGGFVPGEYSDIEYTYQEAVRIGLADTLAELADLEKSGVISIGDTELFDARGFVQRITGDVPSENDKSWNVREAIQYIYSLQDDSKKVKRLQDSLRMAGYFQSLQSLPQSGVLDDATRQAWDLFLVDTIRSGKTPAEQLNVSTGNFRNMLTSGAGYLAVDPASVESMARSMGEALMGRGLSGEEVNSLMENVRTWEQQAFNRAQTAPEQQKTDLEARIEQHIRKQYRNEIAMEQWDSEVSRIKKVLG